MNGGRKLYSFEILHVCERSPVYRFHALGNGYRGDVVAVHKHHVADYRYAEVVGNYDIAARTVILGKRVALNDELLLYGARERAAGTYFFTVSACYGVVIVVVILFVVLFAVTSKLCAKFFLYLV